MFWIPGPGYHLNVLNTWTRLPSKRFRYLDQVTSIWNQIPAHQSLNQAWVSLGRQKIQRKSKTTDCNSPPARDGEKLQKSKMLNKYLGGCRAGVVAWGPGPGVLASLEKPTLCKRARLLAKAEVTFFNRMSKHFTCISGQSCLPRTILSAQITRRVKEEIEKPS